MPFQIPEENSFLDTKELLKYILLLGSAPIWVPFLKALWEDFKKTMDEEGGLHGPRPSRRQQEELNRQLSEEDDPQVHEPIANARARRGNSAAGGASSRTSSGHAGRSGGAGPKQSGGGRKGFRR